MTPAHIVHAMAMVRAAEAADAAAAERRAAARGASRAVIERNTLRHAYAAPAPHHQDEKCTICLSVFEVHSDCRSVPYTTLSPVQYCPLRMSLAYPGELTKEQLLFCSIIPFFTEMKCFFFCKVN